METLGGPGRNIESRYPCLSQADLCILWHEVSEIVLPDHDTPLAEPQNSCFNIFNLLRVQLLAVFEI